MKKKEFKLLWKLAIAGFFVFIVRNLKKNDKKEEFQIGNLPVGFRKIGDISSILARCLNDSKCFTFTIKPGPIVVTELFYQHIKRKHNEEINFHSYRDLDIYVKNVVNNFNEIWLGSDESILLVVDNESKNEKPRYQIVALQMNEMIDDERKVCWNVHTAQSRKKRSPKNTLLWKK